MKTYVEDAAENMEMQFEEWNSCINRKTGEFISFHDDEVGEAEECGTVQEILDSGAVLDEKQAQQLFDYLTNCQDYVTLPNRNDIHEYSIMEDFIDSLEDPGQQNSLYRAIDGRGAFRMFKNEIGCLEIRQDWFDFKFQAYCEIAEEWLQDNDLPYAFKNKRNGA